MPAMHFHPPEHNTLILVPIAIASFEYFASNRIFASSTVRLTPVPHNGGWGFPGFVSLLTKIEVSSVHFHVALVKLASTVLGPVLVSDRELV